MDNIRAFRKNITFADKTPSMQWKVVTQRVEIPIFRTRILSRNMIQAARARTCKIHITRVTFAPLQVGSTQTNFHCICHLKRSVNRKYCTFIKTKSIHTTGRNFGISVIHTNRLQFCNVLYKSNSPHCNTNGRVTSDSQNNYLNNFHENHYEHFICFTFCWPCIMQ
jgi:hypothetical protein